MDGPNDLSKAVPQDSTPGNEYSSVGNEISGRMMMLDRDWVALQLIPRHVLFSPIILFHSYLNSFL